jgi:hypothetical protein
MMLRFVKLLFIFAIPVFFFAACDSDKEQEALEPGKLNLYLTDAPIDTDDITGVFITFSEIQYHTQGNDWMVFDEFDEPVTVNLMDYTHGASTLLGFFEMLPGTYTQIRFMLEAPEHGQGPPVNPGCYLEFEDGTTEPLFVPSGSQSGFKATGKFTVPINGSVDVTADFDLRKSIVAAGNSGRYILKPTIRLIVNDQAGRIVGEVSNVPENNSVVVYAYEADTYTEEEADAPADEEVRFPNAINSDMLCENNMYHIDYLAEGLYDLIVALTLDGEFIEVAGIIEDVEVIAGETTHHNIDISEL